MAFRLRNSLVALGCAERKIQKRSRVVVAGENFLTFGILDC